MRFVTVMFAVSAMLVMTACGVSQETKDSARQIFSQGNEEFNGGNVDKAIELYTQSIDLYNEDTDVFFSRGYAYYNKKEYAKAISDLTHVIEMKNDEGKAYYFRGLSKNKSEVKEGLIEDFQLAEKYTRSAESGNEKEIHDSALKILETSKIDILE